VRPAPPFVATSLTVAVLGTLAAAPSAVAAVDVTVQPGDTLWSIAARNNLTTRTLAAYNGLPEDGSVVLGSTVKVPTVAEGSAALQQGGAQPASSGSSGATGASGQGSTGQAAAGAPAPMGSYVVRAGDTLSGLAASARVPVAQMASMNGLDPDAPLLTGTVVKLPSGAPAPARSSEPEPAEHVVPKAAPAATSQRVGAGDVQSVAAQHGVPPSLAAAIAWQESGFNNSMVSDANARGVMQVMPGTWSWVQDNLADRQLDPNSANDNVHAGVMYLKQLLADTGGDENAAIAGYYQGLGSVRSRGLFDDTKSYVSNVQALRSRFGG
jgi:N-acetylmuramoyl-L-alanine amidase